ncbi:unnamed protein product [Caenorhabditis sp. 36 PRJEB53466]|nr:unnamed protein product [Caenorhabditis sp. 36 PRJEB53466]
MNFFIPICLLTSAIAASIPENRLACKQQDVVVIPDAFDYFLEPMELSFDSSFSFNSKPITRIIEEECDFRDKEIFVWGDRQKRSIVKKGVRHLVKMLHHLYNNGKRLFRPELVREITKVLAKVKHPKDVLKSSGITGIFSFWYNIWMDPSAFRAEVDTAHFDEMLENVLRGSIQMLRNQGHLTEMLLNHPSVLSKIKRRMPIENQDLLSMVEASNVECHQGHRDSQVTIFLKLKIPKVKRVSGEMCDDIGQVSESTYQYYSLPTFTFSHNGHYKVNLKKCTMESFLFCPITSMLPTKCTKDSVEFCGLPKKEKLEKNFFRELSVGFAVYGDFRQVIVSKGEFSDQWKVDPNVLYHVVPTSNETVFIGNQVLKQETQVDSFGMRKI